ncbi:hypothetical protein CBS101457_000226 [Exobasidium rhododendri]|nr:hypothetical protein CBS101457_000226 [Exobasidium rhododendri]
MSGFSTSRLPSASSQQQQRTRGSSRTNLTSQSRYGSSTRQSDDQYDLTRLLEQGFPTVEPTDKYPNYQYGGQSPYVDSVPFGQPYEHDVSSLDFSAFPVDHPSSDYTSYGQGAGDANVFQQAQPWHPSVASDPVFAQGYLSPYENQFDPSAYQSHFGSSTYQEDFGGGSSSAHRDLPSFDYPAQPGGSSIPLSPHPDAAQYHVLQSGVNDQVQPHYQQPHYQQHQENAEVDEDAEEEVPSGGSSRSSGKRGLVSELTLREMLKHPFTDLGFPWTELNGHTLCWRSMAPLPKRLILLAVNKETSYDIDHIRSKMIDKVTPVLATHLLSADDDQIQAAVAAIYKGFYEIDRQPWKRGLWKEQQEELVQKICARSESRNERIRAFLRTANISSEEAVQLYQSKDENELEAFVVKYNLRMPRRVKAGRPRKGQLIDAEAAKKASKP